MAETLTIHSKTNFKFPRPRKNGRSRVEFFSLFSSVVRALFRTPAEVDLLLFFFSACSFSTGWGYVETRRKWILFPLSSSGFQNARDRAGFFFIFFFCVTSRVRPITSLFFFVLVVRFLSLPSLFLSQFVKKQISIDTFPFALCPPLINVLLVNDFILLFFFFVLEPSFSSCLNLALVS